MSGRPMKYSLRSFSFCVATPVAQLFRWQMRRYLQPSATIGPVPKPKDSAPRIAALMTSSPVFRPPSVCTRTRPRRPLARSTCWASDRPELPRRAGVLHRSQGACAGAAVVAGNGDEVGVGLGHARGDRADAGLGDQLHRHQRIGIDLLEVENQLRQILDRVNVVMRRRRNQRRARLAVAQAGDHRRHLVARQLAALAGLGALGDLDLQHLGVDQVGRGVTPKRPEATCLILEVFTVP